MTSSNVTPPVTVMVLVCGPSDPAAKRGLSGVLWAATASPRQARRRGVDGVNLMLQVVFSESTMRVPPKVLVQIMSAPACR